MISDQIDFSRLVIWRDSFLRQDSTIALKTKHGLVWSWNSIGPAILAGSTRVHSESEQGLDTAMNTSSHGPRKQKTNKQSIKCASGGNGLSHVGEPPPV